MSTLLSRAHRMAMARLGAMLCVLGLALAGCGGGGASANGSDDGDGGVNGGGNARTGTTLSTGAATLTGVVATGTPVLAGTVRVYDALGVDQGTATTSATDGSYTLPLSTASRSLPLFVQATGSDMLGAPVVVHSVVQTLATGASSSNTVHLNTLTDAVVALLLGGDPSGFFATPTAYTAWAQLSDSTALALATAFVNTVVAANLRDAGLSNAANVNFFSDPAFVANKTGVDAVLEGLRTQFGRHSNSHPVLQISNRLALTGSTEVSIDLTAAAAMLAGTLSAIDNTTVLTPAKVTTGSSTVMPSLSALNALTATLNVAMARHYDVFQMAGEPILSADYAYYDGHSVSETLDDLVGFGLADYQFTDFQVTGCLDDTIAGTGCVRIGVAAQMRDADGNVVGVYRNAVTYTAQTGWRLRGNDRQTPWTIRTVAWQTWDGAGAPVTATPAAGEAANAGTGLQATIVAREFMRATLQMPNNTALVFSHCDVANWTPMCLEAAQTGDLLRDQVIRTGIGAIDTAVGARYRILTETVGNGTEDNMTRLTAGLPSVASASVFPLPDAITTTPVTIADFINGLTVSWADWAAANPQLRMVELHTVIRTTTLPVKNVVTIKPLSGTQATLAPFLTVPGDAQSHVLWMIAEDALGRRYISKIIAQP